MHRSISFIKARLLIEVKATCTVLTNHSNIFPVGNNSSSFARLYHDVCSRVERVRLMVPDHFRRRDIASHLDFHEPATIFTHARLRQIYVRDLGEKYS